MFRMYDPFIPRVQHRPGAHGQNMNHTNIINAKLCECVYNCNCRGMFVISKRPNGWTELHEFWYEGS